MPCDGGFLLMVIGVFMVPALAISFAIGYSYGQASSPPSQLH